MLALPYLFPLPTGLKELAKEYEKAAKKQEAAKKKEALRLRQIESQNRIKQETKAQELLELQLKTKELGGKFGEGKWGGHHHGRLRSSLDRWNKRLSHSQLLAKRGGWEKRRHETSGNVFWYKTPPPTAVPRAMDSVKSFAYDPPTPDWIEAELALAKGHDLPPPSGEEEEDDDTSMASSSVDGFIIARPPLPPSDQNQSPTGSNNDDESLLRASSMDEQGGRGQQQQLGKRQVKKLEDILEGLSTNEQLIGKIADRIGAHAFVPLLKRDPTVDPLDRDLEEEDR